jgi:hypothetical protein
MCILQKFAQPGPVGFGECIAYGIRPIDKRIERFGHGGTVLEQDLGPSTGITERDSRAIPKAACDRIDPLVRNSASCGIRQAIGGEMGEVTGKRDDSIMGLRVAFSSPRSDAFNEIAHSRQRAGIGPRSRCQDPCRAFKKVGIRECDARFLMPRHGMTAYEPPAQYPFRLLHELGLGAAYIRDYCAGWKRGSQGL